MGTIGYPGRTRRLQDFERLKSSVRIAVAGISMPIIILSHSCPESATNHLEIIHSTPARSPQNVNERRFRKSKKITRFRTSEIKCTQSGSRDISAYNHCLSHMSRISIISPGNHRLNIRKIPSKWEREAILEEQEDYKIMDE
jgi:hypothetical protein